MAGLISPPGPDEDARELWRKVAECSRVLNALQNMQVVVEGKVHMLGKLTMSGDSCKLEIKEAKEVYN